MTLMRGRCPAWLGGDGCIQSLSPAALSYPSPIHAGITSTLEEASFDPPGAALQTGQAHAGSQQSTQHTLQCTIYTPGTVRRDMVGCWRVDRSGQESLVQLSSAFARLCCSLCLCLLALPSPAQKLVANESSSPSLTLSDRTFAGSQMGEVKRRGKAHLSVGEETEGIVITPRGSHGRGWQISR